MDKLTDDLNIIQNLPNQPTLNSSELKREFDSAGNIIKNYLNDVVVEGVTKIEGDYVTTGALNTYKDEVNETIQEQTKAMDDFKNEVNTSLGNAMNEGDFLVEATPTYTINHGNGGTNTHSATISKTGYIPLGIVGHECSGTVNPAYTTPRPIMMSLYLSNRVVGSCKINAKINHSNNADWTYTSTYKAYILWVKDKS